MKKVFPKNNKGFSLVEIIIYLAIMVVIALAVVQSIILVVKSNKQSFVSNNIKNSAVSALEEMTRDIRNATSIDLASSTLKAANGRLQLNSTDTFGNQKVTTFYLRSNVLMINASSSSGVLAGPITFSGTKVLSLKFIPITTQSSSAVKIEMVIESNNQGVVEDQNFYSTTILRGSY